MTPAKLIAKRKTLGMTQAQLADRLGLNRRQIIRMEKGETPIRSAYSELLRYIESAPGAHPANKGD